MRIPRVSTLVGVAAMLLGGGWVCMMLPRPFASAASSRGAGEMIFDVIFSFLMALPGIMGIYLGFRLIREKAPRYFKGVVGVFAVVAALWISIALEYVWPFPVQERIGHTVFLLPGSILAVLGYAYLATFLMRREGLQVSSPYSLVGRGAVLLVSFEIDFVGSRVLEVYAPLREGFTSVDPLHWNLLLVFAPLGAAVLFYQIALGWLRRSSKRWDRDKQFSQSPPPAV